ncbi:MAG: ABC transporter permease, partial [Longimicrobiales bacterium]
MPALDVSPEQVAEIIEELALQLEATYEAARATGRSEEEARERAQAEVTDWEALAREVTRIERPIAAHLPRGIRPRLERPVPGVPFKGKGAVAGLGFDIRYALRVLRRSPGFTAVAMVTLALGIGANTAIFTLLDAVLFRPLPVPAAHELVTLYETAPQAAPDLASGSGRYLRFSYPRFERLERALSERGSLAAMTRPSTFVARIGGITERRRVRGQLVSGGYFSIVRIGAARGRLLSPADARFDAEPVAVIRDGFATRAFGGTDDAIGRTLAINGVGVLVVGVTPPGFAGVWADGEVDVWLPLALQTRVGHQNNYSSYGGTDSAPWLEQDQIAWLNLVGRITPTERPNAEALLQAANHAALSEFAETLGPNNRADMLARTLAIEPFERGFSRFRGQYSTALFALTALAAVVLLVTCANLANLLLVRAAGRTSDMAIRIALGAAHGRLIRQALMESVVLALPGGVLGFLSGIGASGFLARQLLGTRGPLAPGFSPDARVILFAVGLSLATAVLFGVAPALRATRAGYAASVTTSARRTIAHSSLKAMRPLVAAQLALSFVAAVAAVLLGRTLVNLTRLDPGFAIDHLVGVGFDARGSGYTDDRMAALGERLVVAVETVPGVTSASLARCGLFASCYQSSGFDIDDIHEDVGLRYNWVGAHYFATVGIRVAAGREFDERDTADGSRVAVVNESLARRFFQGRNPVGKRLGFGESDTEIIGVVRDA